MIEITILLIIAASSVWKMSMHPLAYQSLSKAWDLGPSYPVCIADSVLYMLCDALRHFLGRKQDDDEGQ